MNMINGVHSVEARFIVFLWARDKRANIYNNSKICLKVTLFDNSKSFIKIFQNTLSSFR